MSKIFYKSKTLVILKLIYVALKLLFILLFALPVLLCITLVRKTTCIRNFKQALFENGIDKDVISNLVNSYPSITTVLRR